MEKRGRGRMREEEGREEGVGGRKEGGEEEGREEE